MVPRKKCEVADLCEKVSGDIVIIFGTDNESQCPFEAAARYLAEQLKEKHHLECSIEPMNISNGGDFMKKLLEKRENDCKILEFHVFSHAWQSGASLNYGASPTSADLQSLVDVYGSVAKDYYIGSDDLNEFRATQLRISNFHYLTIEQLKRIRSNFAKGAKAQFWGCNTNDGSLGLAETFAEYVGISTWGSPANTHFEAEIDKKWTKKYPPVGKRAKFPFKMVPDKGQYKEHKPTLKLEQLTLKELKPKQPEVEFLDEEMKPIEPDPQNSSLYPIKCASDFLIILKYIPEDQSKTITFLDLHDVKIDADKLMMTLEHPNWKLDGGKVLISKGNIFQATARTLLGKKFYIKVVWQGGSLNAKDKILTFVM